MDEYVFPSDSPLVAPPAATAPAGPPAARSRAAAVRTAAVVLAGVVAGWVGVTALHGSPTSTQLTAASDSSAVQDQAPGGAAVPGTDPGAPGGTTAGTAGGTSGGTSGTVPGSGAPGGGAAGRAGETRVIGTLTAVGSASVTLSTPDGGTRTIPTDAATVVERDGRQVALSDLRVGEQALVHVLTRGSGVAAERVLVGSTRAFPGEGRGPGRGYGDGDRRGTPDGFPSGGGGTGGGAPGGAGSGSTGSGSAGSTGSTTQT